MGSCFSPPPRQTHSNQGRVIVHNVQYIGPPGQPGVAPPPVARHPAHQQRMQYQNPQMMPVMAQGRQGPMQRGAPPAGGAARAAPGMSAQAVYQVKLLAFIYKSSVVLDPSVPQQPYYNIKFNFSSDTNCAIKLHFFAVEDKNGGQEPFKKGRPFWSVNKYSFGPGQNQQFCQPFFNFSHVNSRDLTFADRKTYPLIVETIALCEHFQAQITYFIIQVNSSEVKLKAIRQRVVHGNQSNETMEMYGLSNTNDTDVECVVCLSEMKNTAILPCNHVCLCHECAKLLIDKRNAECPICRGPASNFMKLDIR